MTGMPNAIVRWAMVDNHTTPIDAARGGTTTTNPSDTTTRESMVGYHCPSHDLHVKIHDKLYQGTSWRRNL